MNSDLLAWLLPIGVTLGDAAVLTATSFITAIMTAAMGIGGGVALLAVIASIVPPLAIIPVHGLVQTGANLNRALLTRHHIDRPVLRGFLIGALVAALIAPWIVVQLPAATILIAVGSFILYLSWGPPLPNQALQGWPLRLAAAISTLLSMFVGASGPLVAAFTQQLSSERYVRVATLSACMSIQHLLKLLVFGWLGFAFHDWVALTVAMIASGMFGTWAGLHLLAKIDNVQFSRIFRWVLTLMALRLLYTGAMQLL